MAPPEGETGAGFPFAAGTASRRVPDCGRPVHSPLPPPGPKRRRVLRRAATLASVASIARLSVSLGPCVRKEHSARAVRRHWGRPRAHQAPPPTGQPPLGGAPSKCSGSLVTAFGSCLVSRSRPHTAKDDKALCWSRGFGLSFVFFIYPSFTSIRSISTQFSNPRTGLCLAEPL